MKRDPNQIQIEFEQIRPEPILSHPSTSAQSGVTTQLYMEQYLSQVDLIKRIDALENEMKKLEGFFAVNTAVINTLGNPRWELRQPLSISVEQRGVEDFVACLYDVDLYGYGDTVPEALNDLKIAVINQFEYLIGQDRKIQLGKPLKRQLQFLRNILVKTDA